ncbi:acyltransferase domain-containing protein [Streptomyces sp. MMCC 100]|uniref:acyltransferase domain-containing protein n=1 Tax=Streptomyces sp. MMCC 100 TaxID=3163555 RepID=UPI003598C375
MTTAETAVLFPGQGAFDGAALRAARMKYQQVDQVFKAVDTVAEEIFGSAVSTALFEGAPLTAEDLLQQPIRVSQLAIYGSDVAAWRIMRDNGLRARFLVGHSQGEIAALVAAEAFSVEDGARIVAERLRVLQDAEAAVGRMAALALDGQRTRRLLALLDDPALVVAAENHDRQTVISGPERSVLAALRVARELSAGGVLLKSPFAFHTPALEPLRAPLAARIARLPRQAPQGAVYSPILERTYRADDDLPALIAEHLVRPVGFLATVRTLHGNGVTTFVEAGGLNSLGRCVQRVLAEAGDITVRSTFTLDSAGRLGVEEAVTGLSGPGAESFEQFWARYGAQLVERVRTRLSDGTVVSAGSAAPGAESAAAPAATTVPAGPAESAPPPDAAGVPAAAGVPDRTELLAAVRSLYAQALEYPEEVFTEDVLLEAELGIDSVKQVELLNRVTGRYGIVPTDSGFRLSDCDTVGKVVDLLQARLTDSDVPVAAV